MNWMCWVWEPDCNITGIAAWFQAVFSIVAIVYSSRIAMRQVREQHQLDMQMMAAQKETRKTSIKVALNERLKHATGILKMMHEEIDTAYREGRSIPGHMKQTMQDMLDDLVADVNGLSIYELDDVNLIKRHAVLRSAFRQIVYNYKLFASFTRPYTKEEYEKINSTINQIRRELSSYMLELND
jgi:hypothetical protein